MGVVSATVRKAVLYVGAVLLLLGILMIAFAGGGMLLMDIPFLLVGGGMVAWAIVKGRQTAA